MEDAVDQGASQDIAQDAGGQAQDAGSAQPKVTVEELQRKLDEQVKLAREFQSRYDRAQADLERSTNLKDTLEKVAQLAATKEGKDSDPELDWAKLRAEVDEKPHRALQIARAWLEDAQERGKKDSESKLAEIEKRMAALNDRIIKSGSEFQENREMAEELMAAGVPLEKAVELAKKHRVPKPTRQTPPGAIETGGGGGDEPLNADEIARIESITGKLTDAEKAKLRKRSRK